MPRNDRWGFNSLFKGLNPEGSIFFSQVTTARHGVNRYVTGIDQANGNFEASRFVDGWGFLSKFFSFLSVPQGINRLRTTSLALASRRCFCISGQFKCDVTRAETTFRLSVKRTSPFKSSGGVSSVDYWQPRCAHQR